MSSEERKVLLGTGAGIGMVLIMFVTVLAVAWTEGMDEKQVPYYIGYGFGEEFGRSFESMGKLFRTEKKSEDRRGE